MTERELLYQLARRVADLESSVTALQERMIDEGWNADVDDALLSLPTLSTSSQEEVQVGEDDLQDLDPEERAAVLAARQRLANETGGSIEQPDPGRRAESDGEVVELPPVDRERADRRIDLAELLDLDGEFGAGFNDAYVRGGPLWLYYGNREYVMGLPVDIQQSMVEDVAQDSQQEALEMGRDLFKLRGPQGGVPGLDLG